MKYDSLPFRAAVVAALLLGYRTRVVGLTQGKEHAFEWVQAAMHCATFAVILLALCAGEEFKVNPVPTSMLCAALAPDSALPDCRRRCAWPATRQTRWRPMPPFASARESLAPFGELP